MKLSKAIALTPIFAISLGLGGCPLKTATVTDTFCTNYEPIRASRKDTPETLKQVKGQNAVYDRLCKAPVRAAAESMLSK